MVPNCVLVSVPSIDFGTFLGLSQQALGHSPASKVDASPLIRSDAERFLACLSELHEGPHLLTHVSFSVLAMADDRDMLDILQVCGMSFVVTDTLMRGVQLAVITGTLSQWKTAIASCSHEFNVQAFFNRAMALFKEAGLDVWKDYATHQRPDRTFYLEYKP